MPDEQAAPPEQPVAPPDADILAQLAAQGEVKEGTDSPKTAEEPSKEPEPTTPRESAFARNLARRERELVAKQQKHSGEVQAWEQSFEQRVRARVEEEVSKVLAEANVIKQKERTPEEVQAEASQKLRNELREELKKEFLQRDAVAQRTSAETSYTTLFREMAAGGQLQHASSEWDEGELIEQTHRLVAEIRADAARTGRRLPDLPAKEMDRRLLLILDKRAQAKQAARQERQKKTPSPDKTDTKAETNGSGHQGKQAGASATTTLGKGLGERVGVPSHPTGILSDDEVLEQAREAINRGTAPKAKYTP